MDSPELKAFKDLRGEAAAEEWLRNKLILGTMAITAALNGAEATRVSLSDHATTTVTGIAFAAGVGLTLEWGRRRAAEESHVHARKAVKDAAKRGEPAPEWTIGNTGDLNLLNSRPLNI